MYAELHCHSNFSFCDGASSVGELIRRAAELSLTAMALTDHEGLYGAVEFYRAAQGAGVKPLIGAELTIEGGYHLTLLAESQHGYGNLSRLVTLAHKEKPKGEACLSLPDLSEHHQGLIGLSGCRKGPLTANLLQGKREEARRWAAQLADIFPRGCFYVELQRHFLPGERRLVRELVGLARELRLPYVATGNVHYARPEGYQLQHVLTCIGHNLCLDEAGEHLKPNREYHLKGPEEMRKLFADIPEAVEASGRIAGRCKVQLEFGGASLPRFSLPAGTAADKRLRELCYRGVASRYGEPCEKATRQLEHELEVIRRLGLVDYFLVVHDIVEFAYGRGIRCQGRGSAGNSLVAYVLGITRVDPIAHNLLFERFLSLEHASTPDIDVDFAAARREEVIQYLYRKYGPEHAAMVANVITFRARSAVRDVGKALGFPASILDRAAKCLDVHRASEIEGSAALFEEFGEELSGLPWRELVRFAQALDGYPRHLGVHLGGMVITGKPLVEMVPIEPARMEGRVVTQWDKDSIEEVGLVKIDILSLRTLSAVSDTLELLKQAGREVNLDRIPLDDTKVYDMICQADTVGVFQIESRAQMQTLPRMNPRRFEDLVVEVAIIRPGPIQGGMVHPYLRRRRGEEPVTYLHPLLEPVLRDTLGVILFQEQVLKVARDVAGFTPGEGDLLRRAMTKKRSEEEMERFHGRFIEGAGMNGVPQDIAERVFTQVAAFASYGFPASHSVALARLTYETAWLKRHHPAEYACALLNNQPMGFYSPSVVVNDARRHGVKVLPVDINRSRAKCCMEEGAVRLGFAYVDGLGERALEVLERGAKAGVYGSLRDFCGRTRLPRPGVENLIMAGAFDSLGIPRRKLLWELEEVLRELARRHPSLDLEYPDEGVELPEMTGWEQMAAEYGFTGLSTGNHLVSGFQAELAQMGALDSQGVLAQPDGARVVAGGLVVSRQRPPTAKGFVFITLEDERGMINVIVRPKVYEAHRVAARVPLIVVKGHIQRENGVVNLIAESLQPLEPPKGGRM